MSHILPTAGIALVLCQCAYAQSPPDTPAPLRLTLQDAMDRARKYSQLTFNANITALLAREDVVQARAATLPLINGFSQYIYTQGNGTPSGVFVPNDGVHIYNDQAQMHADLFAPAKRADYHRAMAAEAAARARADVANRGLVATVMQDFYGMAVAARKLANAEISVRDAESLVDITGKQEQAGEVAQADSIKARLQLNDRRRDLAEAQLAVDKARITFAVLLFPDYQANFTVVDDLDALSTLPAYGELQALAGKGNPDIRAAQAAVLQQSYEIRAAHFEMLPTLSLDYFFGISANQFATHNPEGNNLLGSVVQAQLTVPIWTWGASRSKVRAAELKLQQARNDLTFTQRQLLGNLDSYYREAALARSQLALLRDSADLSRRSLDLTVLRYQAGEATILEVVDAQNSARDARNALDDGLARLRIGIANLQTLTGAF